MKFTMSKADHADSLRDILGLFLNKVRVDMADDIISYIRANEGKYGVRSEEIIRMLNPHKKGSVQYESYQRLAYYVLKDLRDLGITTNEGFARLKSYRYVYTPHSLGSCLIRLSKKVKKV